MALTDHEYTEFDIEDWFTYSVPFCNAKKYEITSSVGVILKSKDFTKMPPDLFSTLP